MPNCLEAVIGIGNARSDRAGIHAMPATRNETMCICLPVETLRRVASTVPRHASLLKQAEQAEGGKNSGWGYEQEDPEGRNGNFMHIP
ncbi:MAG: hypothetical protein GF363_07520 [Chitinivibrionales bacterium]|nr:hypothetical protein [Chitinivibrionales bacterium]